MSKICNHTVVFRIVSRQHGVLGDPVIRSVLQWGLCVPVLGAMLQ